MPVAGADIRLSSRDRAGVVLDPPLLAMAAGGSVFAESLLLPTLVLPVLVAQLTPDRIVVGFVGALPAATWLVAQALAGLLLHGRTRLKPLAAVAALVRVCAFLLLARSAFSPEVTRASLLSAILLAAILAALANAVAQHATAALAARVVVANAQRGLLGVRSIAASGLAILAGLVLASALSPTGPGVAHGIGLIALLAAFAAGFGALALLLVREPGTSQRYRSTPPADAIDGSVAASRNPAIRRFALYRLLLGAVAATDPFLLVYAGERVGMPLRYIGLAVVAYAGGRLVAPVIWGRIDRLGGPRFALQVVAAIRLAIPAIALAVAFVGSDGIVVDRIAWAAILVPCAMLGVAHVGQGSASFTYLATLGDITIRRNAARLVSALLAIVAFGPIVAGSVADTAGLQPVLVVAMVLALAAFLAAAILTDPHPRVRRQRGARSQTRARTARR